MILCICPHSLCVCCKNYIPSQKKETWVVPHRLRVSSNSGIKPSYTLQELPAFVRGKLCDIMPLSPFPVCVCCKNYIPSKKKKITRLIVKTNRKNCIYYQSIFAHMRISFSLLHMNTLIRNLYCRLK